MAMASTKVGAGLLYHAAFRWVIGPRFCSEWAAKEALESFSPEGVEPGREISAVSCDGTLVLVYIPSEVER